MMQHTRRQIIDYLRSNRIATSTELGRALLVTPANVRHHLKLLRKERLVEVVGLEPARGRGRPTKVYCLTENALTQNLGGLTGALLKALLACRNDVEVSFLQVAKNLLGDYQAASNWHTQLKQVVEKLNHLKYQATWEASPKGPRIIFRNCPYAAIISEYPEICAIDTALLEYMLNRSILQSAKLERSPDGSPHCAFIPKNDES